MIVVSDTTPLNYLVLIGAVEVLPKLFEEVHVPREVMRELDHPRTPEVVSHWIKNPPSWVKLRSAGSRLASTARLDPGEAEAISLAKEIGAPAVLLDEIKGRKVALSEGLIVVRTLALLELAAERGLVDLKQTLEKLSKTEFRVTRDLIDAALARDVQKKSQ